MGFSMKNIIRKFISFILLRVLRFTPENILYFAYYTNNIPSGHDLANNGEMYLIKKVKNYFSKKEKVIIFDVGANDGSYTNLISDIIQNSEIYAFEPNFELVQKSNYSSAKVFPIGLGERKQQANLYFNKNALQEASIYEGVAKHSPKTQDGKSLKKLDIEIDELGSFCTQNNISTIDFIKIDTEGNEYAVLLGAKQMLCENKIQIIQFEFNEMNVVSRVFLKDFYDLLLNNYKIYRLHKNKLFPMETYHAHNEIFVWHNLVAVNRTITEDFLLA
jgi:FkbM family methyltransferase